MEEINRKDTKGLGSGSETRGILQGIGFSEFLLGFICPAYACTRKWTSSGSSKVLQVVDLFDPQP